MTKDKALLRMLSILNYLELITNYIITYNNIVN